MARDGSAGSVRRVWVEWDTETDEGRQAPEALGLPCCMEVPADLQEDEVADVLSDRTGWLVAAWGWEGDR